LTDPTPLPRDPARGDAHARFKEAVLALSDEPTPTNLLRYLQASRVLEAARPRMSSKNAA
jgi:hypothetical protein